jgi:C4-dicarboxylate-specific signal transduction histidine kinase
MLIKLSTFALFTLILGVLKRALERSDDRLIKVLEGLDAAVWVLDPAADSILYRNRHFAPIFTGKRRIETARDAQRLLGIDRETGHPAEDRAALHIGELWFLVRTRTLTWTDGRPVLLVTATDITDRRLAEESSRAQRERLLATARLVTVGEIAGSIAHELNQPLAAIASYLSGSLRRLRAGRAEPEGIAGALEEAVRQAERAGEIIRRVRDFVRARETALVTTDLNGVVARAARFAAPDAERLGARIELALAAALPPARGDPVMLEQVVINLVRNALEAMNGTPPDQRVVEIATARADDGVLEVTVADAGPGIAPEVAARLFEPFFTTKPEGTGLGLNICRSIVEVHGGRLSTAASRLGGSLFRFTVHTANGQT